MNWLDHLAEFWPHIVAVFGFLASLFASIHAVLNKRDSRAAALWLGFIWLLPVLGPLLYLALGVNRIRRRALSLRMGRAGSDASPRPIPRDMGEPHRLEAEHLRMLARVVDRVATRPSVAGNHIQALVNGDQAFPAMLAAIEEATISVSLATYIFDNDPSGNQFAEALGRAVKRGVQVRVLIDDAGARYSWPSIVGKLKRAGVPVARFLPTLAPWRLTTINLHNHRKLLVADGRIGFTGGINIRAGNVLAAKPRRPVQDLHFKVEGPVVTQLQEAFADDWAFCTKEVLAGDAWFPALKECGKVIARVITDGPEVDLDKLRWTLLGALSCAQSSVRILTPYFLPDQSLITALNLAVLRGVQVDIILPRVSNLPYVRWASRAMWWQVLERGCRIWLTPPPFDHSKLMIVDNHWVFLGSANWDPRSLRLNFELNVECYGRDFAAEMDAIVQNKLRGAKPVTLEEVDGRSLPVRLRDGVARLFTPYL
ncbi:MAG TPA: phospholipase D-like domain-containing protein [Candidatus Angelobacter sp.]|nr:phospholipase D-like domain-containing protein [Candidatus Angelobacter sp.]